jgi:hypothetical protein
MTDPKIEPPDWWDDFWKRDEENTGQSPEEAIEMLRRLRGETWYPGSSDELPSGRWLLWISQKTDTQGWAFTDSEQQYGRSDLLIRHRPLAASHFVTIGKVELKLT